MTNLEVFTRLGIGNAKVETCLPLSHEADSRIPLLCVRDNARLKRGGSQLRLLRASPPIGMGQDELDFTGHRLPAALSVWIGGNEKLFGRIKEIAHKISEYIDDGFPLGELRAHLILHLSGWLRGRHH